MLDEKIKKELDDLYREKEDIIKLMDIKILSKITELQKSCDHRDAYGNPTIVYDDIYEMRSKDMHCTQCNKIGSKNEILESGAKHKFVWNDFMLSKAGARIETKEAYIDFLVACNSIGICVTNIIKWDNKIKIIVRDSAYSIPIPILRVYNIGDPNLNADLKLTVWRVDQSDSIPQGNLNSRNNIRGLDTDADLDPYTLFKNMIED